MTIALDHAGFDHAVHDVRDAATELREARDRADRRVDAFLHGGWTGLAADAFTDAWSDWRRAAGDVLTQLAIIGDLLDDVHVDFTFRDLQVDADLDRLHERLG